MLLTVVLPDTLLPLTPAPYEYAPTCSEMPPPYAFAPLEVEVLPPEVVDDALQLVKVLPEML